MPETTAARVIGASMETCRCSGDLRAEGFSADPAVRAPGVPEHWFVHAGCGLPKAAYAAAMSAA